MEKFKIGIELEFYDKPLLLIKEAVEDLKVILHNSEWIVKSEETVKYNLNGIEYGGEINSPILTYSKKSFEDLEHICELLQCNNCLVHEKISTHFHFDADYFTNVSWVDLVEFWLAYEAVIYRYGYDKKLMGRADVWRFARPLNLYRKNYIEFIDYVRNNNLSFSDVKYNLLEKDKGLFFKQTGLNLSGMIYDVEYYESKRDVLIDKIPTVEIRCFDGTFDSDKVITSIEFFARVFKKINNHEIDIEYLRYKNTNPRKEIYNKFDLSDYKELDCEDAVELVDSVYDCYDDKVKFLKHYIK